MDFSSYLGRLQDVLLYEDAVSFLPELVLCAGIVLMLVLRLFSRLDRRHMGGVALVATIISLMPAIDQWMGLSTIAESSRPKWGSLLTLDLFSVYLRIFILLSTALVVVQTLITRIPDKDDSADFHVLLLGASLGMCLMVSSNHFLMFFIAIEMASLPSYALAGFLKGKRQGSEAALKYVVYGSGASGVMLYGLSLLAGRFGTGYLPDISAGIQLCLQDGVKGLDALLILGTMLFLLGLGFKLAAVPFHFWCPDVFEGAPAEVAGFLSVASKGAALGLLIRFGLTVAGLSIEGGSIPALSPNRVRMTTWLSFADVFVPCVAIIAIVTATFGNLAAYSQTNLKRLLAYSTIAHAGYMLMGVAAFTAEAAGAVLFYLFCYALMNLGAFAVVAFLRNQYGTEDLTDFKGLVRASPAMVISLAFFLFSLVGLPPLAGFAAKFQIFQTLFDAGQTYAVVAPKLSPWMYIMIGFAGINTVFSLVYYVRVLKVMVLEAPEENPSQAMSDRGTPIGSTTYATLMATAVLVVGVAWNSLANVSDQAILPFWVMENSRAARIREAEKESQRDPNQPQAPVNARGVVLE